MKQLSAASIKRGKVAKSVINIPKEGTALRKIYDTLRTGEIISISYFKSLGIKSSTINSAKISLQNCYGCHVITKNKSYQMISEWDGHEYVAVERTNLL
jgi:hypothetical protein